MGSSESLKMVNTFLHSTRKRHIITFYANKLNQISTKKIHCVVVEKANVNQVSIRKKKLNELNKRKTGAEKDLETSAYKIMIMISKRNIN